MIPAVQFSEEVQKRIDAGECVTLGILFYFPGPDSLRIYVPSPMTPEEADAIMRKFGLYLPSEL